jgi:hypothetical protein
MSIRKTASGGQVTGVEGTDPFGNTYPPIPPDVIRELRDRQAPFVREGARGWNEDDEAGLLAENDDVL